MGFDVDKVRESFPITKECVYLNNAATGAHPISVAWAMEAFMKDKARSMLTLSYDMGVWGRRLGECKKLFAQLIGAKEGEVAFIPNTTAGLNIVANMLPYRRGSNVIVSDIEYMSNVIVWLNQADRGVETCVVKSKGGRVLLEDVEKACNDRTIAIAVGQVGWFHGFRHDLKALSKIAHERGAYLVVDGIQSVGAMKIDVKKDGVDFLACGAYKWLLGPATAGFLYIREDLINEFKPPMVSVGGLKPEVVERNIFESFDLHELKYLNHIARYEFTHICEAAYIGAWASMSFLLSQGIEGVEKRIAYLDNYLVEGLLEAGYELQTPLEPKERLGPINFKVRNCREVERRLAEKGIMVSARMGGIRVSPHFFNTEDELDTLLKALKELPK